MLPTFDGLRHLAKLGNSAKFRCGPLGKEAAQGLFTAVLWNLRPLQNAARLQLVLQAELRQLD